MSRNILPEPTAELKRLSDALSARIREEITGEGMIPFSRYMDMALYEPGLGYYSAGLHKLGETGDFVTAPELGPLFSACLAGQVAEIGGVLGSYDILEIGAGSGRLAADLLNSLEPRDTPGRYRILERSADLRRLQRETIAVSAPAWRERVEWLDRPPAESWQGVVIANEVLDALAVERFRIGENGVEQMCVADRNGAFGWASREAPAELARSVAHLAADTETTFSSGYRSEISLHLPQWLDTVTGQMACGLALFVDYGYPRSEFYLPERSDGTLMCHYRHRAHDDVFFWPGLQDITAWVDFTALAEAADRCGLDVEGYSSQAMFLLGCGLDRIVERNVEPGASTGDDDGLAVSSQARQLTMPGQMGERFQVMGLGRGLDRLPARGQDQALRGFSLQDLRFRL